MERVRKRAAARISGLHPDCLDRKRGGSQQPSGLIKTDRSQELHRCATETCAEGAGKGRAAHTNQSPEAGKGVRLRKLKIHGGNRGCKPAAPFAVCRGRRVFQTVPFEMVSTSLARKHHLWIDQNVTCSRFLCPDEIT